MRLLFKIKNRVWRYIIDLLLQAIDNLSHKVSGERTTYKPGELDLIKIRDLMASGWALDIKDDFAARKVVFVLNKKIGRTNKSVISILTYNEILANDLLMRSIMIGRAKLSEASHGKDMGQRKKVRR